MTPDSLGGLVGRPNREGETAVLTNRTSDDPVDSAVASAGGQHTIVTARLHLSPVSLNDLHSLFPILSDPETWPSNPAGRHYDIDTTRAWIEQVRAQWKRDGLSHWTLRLGETDQVIGIGGAQRRTSAFWNLTYRLAVSAWGHGYATELARAALAIAVKHDRHVPVIACIAEHNLRSRRVAERIGLTNHGPRVSDHDGQMRLVYADRSLD